MLKLEQNITLVWDIDWVNKVFKTEDKIIGAIQSIYVDWSLVTDYSYEAISITLDTAPTTSIVWNVFIREVSPIKGNEMVTLGDLKTSFYRKIWRVNNNLTIPANLSRLYPEDYVKEELRKSYKRITNKSPEANRVQQYTLYWTNWYKIISETIDSTVSFEDSLTTEIEGLFLIGKWIAYDYYSVDWDTFKVKDVDLSNIWDKVIIWNRIPYWVDKISHVYVDGVELNYIDNREFAMSTTWSYTIMKDFQGNSHLILPCNDEVQTTVVKYIPDLYHISDEEDLLDIPEEYMDVIVYDTVWRLLRDKEDERWIQFKEDLWTWRQQWLLYEYQSYNKWQVRRTNHRIWLASTFNHR